MSRILAIIVVGLAVAMIFAAYTHRSALVLRQERPAAFWPRHNTTLSGRYSGRRWLLLPGRRVYGGFRGGGPGVGK